MFLTADHDPIAKKRHRHAGNRTYDPQSTDKREMKWHFASQMRAKGYLKAPDGPIAVKMSAYMPKPKSWSQKRLKEAEGMYHTNKPDCDNLAKFYLDVLSGIAYTDDKQVSVLNFKKIYADIPRIEINLQPI